MRVIARASARRSPPGTASASFSSEWVVAAVTAKACLSGGEMRLSL